MAELLHEDPADAGRDHADATVAGRDRWLAWGIIGCAGAAMGVALLLSYGSGEAGGAAPGCGPASGCAEVLASRWSQVLGLKTAMLAFFTYVLIVAATWPVAGLAGWQLQARPMVRQTLAAATIGAAGWFLYLQAFELGAFCKWCMTAHALGVAAAVGTFVRDGRLGKLSPPAAVIGLAGAATLAAVQWTNPPGATVVDAADTQPAAAATPEADPRDRPQADEATLDLLGGRVRLDLAATPALGPADAPDRVVAMFDYACPHCRVAHKLLEERGVRTLVMPVPLNSGCNPGINPGALPARFDDSCTLAELGLAVFYAGGEEAYARYDAAVFGVDDVPAAAEAEATAEAAAPGMTIAHRERAKAAVAENVAAWIRLGEAEIADRLPVLIDTASERVAVGRLYGAEDLDLLFSEAEPSR